MTSSMASDAETPAKNPGLRSEPPDAETEGYFVQQTDLKSFSRWKKNIKILQSKEFEMYRIKDPKESLEFYTNVLGMSLFKKLDFPDMKFSLYFLGYKVKNTSRAPEDPVERTIWTFNQKATIELTHNWGTEKDPKFQGYHNGNSEPRGFGHIGITVNDTYKACKRFEGLNVSFIKKPDEGKLKGIAFIKDPDGYWIEIFDSNNIINVAKSADAKPE